MDASLVLNVAGLLLCIMFGCWAAVGLFLYLVNHSDPLGCVWRFIDRRTIIKDISQTAPSRRGAVYAVACYMEGSLSWCSKTTTADELMAKAEKEVDRWR